MRKWYSIVVVIVVALIVISCGASPNVNEGHVNSFSMMPRYLADKSSETSNNVTFFSFDMESIRAGIPYDSDEAYTAIINKFGIVPSRYYSTNEENNICNPNEILFLASCPYWSVQSFTPSGEAKKNLSDMGYIEEIIGDGYFLAKKYDNNITAELAPANCFIDDYVVQVTTTANYQIEKTKLMLMGETDRISDYSAIKEILGYLPEAQAVAIVFSFESYEQKAESGAVNTQIYDRYQQVDMIPQFELWGRPQEYIIGAVGSNVSEGIEHTTIALLYGDDKTAKDDLISLSSAVPSIPSMITGRSWLEHMNFGKPIIKQNGRVIMLDFDIEHRGEDDGLLSMQMLKLMDQSGDWGLFWRK